MKKIFFSDKFALTQAVLDGRKTQTRRIIKFSPIDAKYVNDEGWSIGGYVASEIINRYSRYKAGEVVAVAQSYKDCGLFDVYQAPKDTVGWTNKMFVKAALMPHRIRITDVRVERLNDISESDCIAEGIVKRFDCGGTPYYKLRPDDDGRVIYRSPREAYAALIDRISGKGTFERNPYVFVYTFELVK